MNATGVEQLVTEQIHIPYHERKHRGQKSMTETLPTKEIVYEIDNEERDCSFCVEARPKISDERTSE